MTTKSEKTLIKYAEIKEALEKYSESLKKTEERRQLWKTETKNKIYDTLKLIEESFSWNVQKIENIDNYQTIKICCNTKSSGIINIFSDFEPEKANVCKPYKKHGGYLAYCQSYNGKINIIIKCPYIEQFVFEIDDEVIATIEPNEITEDLISQHVIKFLNKISEWEGMDRSGLGFKSQS